MKPPTNNPASNGKKEKSRHYIFRHILADVRYFIQQTRNQSSFHWSTSPIPYPKSHPLTVIKIAYLKRSERIALIFSRYHPEAISIIKQIPQQERYFFQEAEHAYLKWSVWCISPDYFEPVHQFLTQLEDIELEFIILCQEKEVPSIFEPLNFTFYPRGKKSP